MDIERREGAAELADSDAPRVEPWETPRLHRLSLSEAALHPAIGSDFEESNS
jgi:hypothetical protein